jgi:N-acetylmuramoyl-L-alanine amidase
VVLKIARELAKQINSEKGYRAVLTRDGDYYIRLADRRTIARNKYNADIFVSIHADAFTSSAAKGASVFAVSQRGATSTMAKFLASHENQSDSIGGVSLSDKEDLVKKVLVDLSMTGSINQSLALGDSILDSMEHITRLHKPHVEQAGFAVLKNLDIPSILVETGFISNPAEAKNLNSSSFRKKMAQAIHSGIKQHFNNYPLEGTYIASLKQQRTSKEYIVTRGDTLSHIASRHNVSVSALQNINDLSGTSIRIGQKLRIPAS